MRPEWLDGAVRERLGVPPHVLDGDHAPMLSQPARLGELLLAGDRGHSRLRPSTRPPRPHERGFSGPRKSTYSAKGLRRGGERCEQGQGWPGRSR